MIFISHNFPLSRLFSLFCFCVLVSLFSAFSFPYMVIAICKKIHCYTYKSFLKIPLGYEVFRVFPRFFFNCRLNILPKILIKKYYIDIYISKNGILFFSRYLNHSHMRRNRSFRITMFK